MFRLFATLMLVSGLAGCDGLPTLFVSTADKVNAAFPLPEEIVTARAALLADLQQKDTQAHAELSSQLAQLMEVRGLTCSSAASVGRFDSIQDVKRKVGSPVCFREQDVKLSEWVGVRRLIQDLRKPPLVPVAALPPRLSLPPMKESTSDIAIAQAANVVATRSGRTLVNVVAVPTGKVIGSFDVPAESTGVGALSPNGHVLAVSGYGKLAFIDTETGNTLWRSDKFRKVLAWLPEIDATLLAGPNPGPVLLDHRKGTTDPYPVPMPNTQWAAPLPGAGGDILLGVSSIVTLAKHARGADGAVVVTPGKQWRLDRSGVTSGQPMVMAGGKKLVFVNNNDLGWLDLATGANGIWDLHFIRASGYSKLSDTQVYLEASLVGNAWQRSPYLFDVEKGTLTPVQPDGNEGFVIALPERSAYARRGNFSNVTLNTAATVAGDEKPLQGMISEAQLALELAKLEAANQATNQAATAANQAAAGANQAAIAAHRAVAGAPAPLLKDIPADAKVMVVGVYEADVGSQRVSGVHPTGTVRVTVGPGKGPLVLVLASYESVTWMVQDGGRPIAAILLSGYQPSTVAGTRAQVHRIGSNYAYKLDSAEYARLKQDIARYVAPPVASFQGVYKGKEFSVY